MFDSVGRQPVRVHMPLFWPKSNSSNFCEIDENPFAIPTSYKHKSDHIFGTNLGTNVLPKCDFPPSVPRICD